VSSRRWASSFDRAASQAAQWEATSAHSESTETNRTESIQPVANAIGIMTAHPSVRAAFARALRWRLDELDDAIAGRYGCRGWVVNGEAPEPVPGADGVAAGLGDE
jgi:hypothetical protein